MYKGCSRMLMRQARYGWIVWAPMVALLFGVLAWDAALNIQLRQTDYQFHKADTERRNTVRRLDETLALEAQMKSMEWLTAQAGALGLRMPALEQVEVVRMDTLFELPLLLDAPEVLPPLAVPPAPAAPRDAGGIRGALLAAAPGPAGPAPQAGPAPVAAVPALAEKDSSLDKSLDALMAPL